MYSSRTPQKATGYLLKTCWSIESRLDRSNKEALQACLQASPYCECPIWRKPNTEEKRSFFEVPGRVSGTIDKLACKRLLIASVQFGESQTPRKSGAFSRWPGRVSGTVGKPACKRLLIARGRSGESQTPRKSEAFSRWAWTARWKNQYSPPFNDAYHI
mgnify:CR=1 FL=1